MTEITSVNKNLASWGFWGPLSGVTYGVILLAKLKQMGSGCPCSTGGYPQLQFFRISSCALVSHPTLIWIIVQVQASAILEETDPVKADRKPTMCCMWLNVNFNINPPTQWSCCYPGFIRLIIRKWKRCYPSPACWGTQLHVSAWSQPYPSSFMTTAKPWQQKTALQHTDLRCSSYHNKLWHSAFCSCAPSFARPISVWLMWRVQCSSPTAPACLYTPNSAFLSLSPPAVVSEQAAALLWTCSIQFM